MASDSGGQPAAGELRSAIAMLRRWGECDPESNPTDLLGSGVESMGFGQPELVGTSSLLVRPFASPERPSIVLVSSHDLGALTPVPRSGVHAGADMVRGPGVGSRAAGLLAGLSGFRAAEAGAQHSVGVLSVGPGDRLTAVATKQHLGSPSLVVFTDGIAWDPGLPTLTVGARGRVEARITITAPAPVNDLAYAGAALNPLNRLVELLGQLRGPHGRVGLPGFYDRADPPDRGALAAAAGDEWLDALRASRATGSLSAIERATQWPVLSVLDLRVDAHTAASPRSATALVAFSLVPRQRPVDVERALRAWLTEHTPPTLDASIRIIRSARPHRSDEHSMPLRALARAIRLVHHRKPLMVPAGGTIGAGEVAYRFGAPVVFAGIVGPGQRYGTTDELLDPSRYGTAVETMRRFREQLESARARS